MLDGIGTEMEKQLDQLSDAVERLSACRDQGATTKRMKLLDRLQGELQNLSIGILPGGKDSTSMCFIVLRSAMEHW